MSDAAGLLLVLLLLLVMLVLIIVCSDGILFGRDTMLRARKVLARDCTSKNGPCLMDMHTGNDDSPGRESVDAITYLNNWAFVDSLWIGEGFTYTSLPVFWLFEISGQAFGLFSDMLGPPNEYRGMLFGSTGRPGCAFPAPIWNFWDSFKIEESDMSGFWQPDTPVKVHDQVDIFVNDANAILATSYVVPVKRTLIAIGSWAAANTTVTLDVDWKVIGCAASAAGMTMKAPAIAGFQPAKDYGAVTQGGALPPILVEPAKGGLYVLQCE